MAGTTASSATRALKGRLPGNRRSSRPGSTGSAWRLRPARPRRRRWPSSSSCGIRTTTPGRRDQRGRPRLRIDGQRQPERVHAGCQPVYDGFAAGRRRCCPASRSTTGLTDHKECAAGRLARRLYGRRRARPLHGPRVSPRVLEPDGVCDRADGAPHRDVYDPALRGRLPVAEFVEPPGQ